jgi:hypothetical protein
LRRLATSFVLLVVLVLLFIVSEVMGSTAILATVSSSVAAASGLVVTLLAVGAAAAGPVNMVRLAGRESSTSRGDVVFQKASAGLKDQLGFMDYVKKELQSLFDFLEYFEKMTGKKLILTCFVDDLDRCLNGENVKVLEAVTLMLSVPGAPVMVMLAIDSRIVVASIDHVFAQSMEIDKTNVSGQEYMDKVVQMPFALPEPSLEKRKRLIEKNLEGAAASPSEVKRRLVAVCEAVEKQRKVKQKAVVLCFPAKSVKDGDTADSAASYVEVRDFLKLRSSFRTDALNVVRTAALMLTEDTKRSAHLSDVLGDEGIEVMCRSVQEALDSMAICKVLEKKVKKVSDLIASGEGAEESKEAAKEEKDETGDDTEIASKDAAGKEWIFASETLQLQEISIPVNFKLSEFLLPRECIDTFLHLAHYIDGNPRRTKRILNVFQVMHGLAELWPLSIYEPEKTVAKDKKIWPALCAKLIKWVCLCEMFPFRMSFLVHVVQYYAQMTAHNKLVHEERNKKAGSRLFLYYQAFTPSLQDEAASKDKDQTETEKLSADMLIAELFAEKVERQLYYEGSERLSILDSDADHFYNLLTMPVPRCDKSGGMVNITVEDILGPLGNDDEPIGCLSLLHYSINLNPALRQQIQADITGYMSQSELKLLVTSDFDTARAGEVVEALPKQSIMRKQALLRDRTPMPREDRRFLQETIAMSPVVGNSRKQLPQRNQNRFVEADELSTISSSAGSVISSGPKPTSSGRRRRPTNTRSESARSSPAATTEAI